MKIVPLWSSTDLIRQYVEMRNGFREQLLCRKVTVKQTLKWLPMNVVLCAVERKTLFGAVVLNRLTGEITIFHNGKKRGLGTILLNRMEKTAKHIGLKKIWAWCRVDNISARILFGKNNYNDGFGFYFGKKI